MKKLLNYNESNILYYFQYHKILNIYSIIFHILFTKFFYKPFLSLQHLCLYIYLLYKFDLRDCTNSDTHITTIQI